MTQPDDIENDTEERFPWYLKLVIILAILVLVFVLVIDLVHFLNIL